MTSKHRPGRRFPAALPLLLPLLLAGCALDRMGTAKEAQRALVGKSKSEILACAGAPERARKEGAWEYLTYVRMAPSSGPGPARHDNRHDNRALAIAMGRRRYCQATFVVKDGKVARLNYAGNTGGLFSRGEQCAYIVDDCLGKK